MPDIRTIDLGTRLSIREVSALHRSWREHLGTTAPIAIDGSSIEECDGAGAQLITAFLEACAVKEIPWSWVGRSARLDDVARVLDLVPCWEPKSAA